MRRIRALVPDNIPRGAELYWHFRARDAELARLVEQDDAFLLRLDGEWCLKYGSSVDKHPSVVLDRAGGNEFSSDAAKRLAPVNTPLSPLQSGRQME